MDVFTERLRGIRTSFSISSSLTALIVIASQIPLNSAYGDAAGQAYRLSKRFKHGVAYSSTDPNYMQMVALIQQGNMVGAADIAAHDRDYYEQTVRQIMAPTINLAEDPTDNAMTDTLALLIGTVKDDRYFPEVLYTNAEYIIQNTNFTSTRITYGQWDPTVANLATDLIRVSDGSDPIGYGLPSQDVSGILSSDKWALEYDKAGTNRRNIKGLMQFSGLIIDDVRAPNPNLFYIARDVNRVPDPFQPNLFYTYCAQCHGAMDAMRGAFFNVDYGSIDANGDMGIVPVPGGASKYAINNTVFPGGYITTSNSWTSSTIDPGVVTGLGWGAVNASGNGIQSLGMAWSKFRSMHKAFVDRAAVQFCPGISLDATTENNLIASFESDGNFRKLCENIAVLPQCLGD